MEAALRSRDLLARERLQDLRLGLGPDARHAAQLPGQRRGAELLRRPDIQRTRDVDRPPRAQPQVPAEPDQRRRQVALELRQLGDVAGLDQLEKARLVRRVPDPDDRRGVLVELTPKGRRLHQEAIGIQAEKEALLAEALTQREKEQLNDLLRRVMLALEARYPGRGGH